MTDERFVDGVQAIGQQRGGFFAPGDSRIVGWIREALEEGERIIKSDPNYSKIDQMMEYVSGNPPVDRGPSYLKKLNLNMVKRALKIHTSTLSDLRPIFSFASKNGRFKKQSILLNDLVLVWWTNNLIDLDLADVMRYALVAGAGDCLVEFDPWAGPYGDITLIPKDPRDTVPVRPTMARSLQSWEGMIIKEVHSVNVLKSLYPDQARLFDRASASWTKVFSRFMRRPSSPSMPTGTLSGLSASRVSKTDALGSNDVNLYRVMLNDRSINLHDKPVVMGQPGTPWSYVVKPGKPLYPRKRLIVSTEFDTVYDGPSPFWHGQYNIIRMKLDPWPWLQFGLSLCSDVLPIQEAIDSLGSDILSNANQAVNRGTVADSRAMPEPEFRRLDIRKPNWKARVNQAMGESFKVIDPPQLPAYVFEMYQDLFRKFEEFTETANLSQLLQLRQMPGSDTIETFYNAATPGLRMEGRLIEAFLRELGEQVKVNMFQFYTHGRRVLLLGDIGSTFQDFDLDRDNMIPSLDKGVLPPEKQGQDPLEIPELSADKDINERAQFFHTLFAFQINPNSILAMHSQTEQMKQMQLARMGYLDFWTMMETMGIKNVGAPPPVPLPVENWEPKIDPNTGVPMPVPKELRVPITITERLQAQQQLGIGQTVSSAGRKASGQQNPELKTKGDGRTVVSESG